MSGVPIALLYDESCEIPREIGEIGKYFSDATKKGITLFRLGDLCWIHGFKNDKNRFNFAGDL
jgi:hypothetical protein